MKKEESYKWVENNFFGDLSEEEMIHNLKEMVNKIYRHTISVDEHKKLKTEMRYGKERYEVNLYHLEECSKMTTKLALENKEFKRLISEGEYHTNENGHIIEFPQFGRFNKNCKVEILSREIK